MHFLSWSFKLAVNGSFYGCVMFNPRHWSGSQISISIQITPNFELVLAMVIGSLLTKSQQNPASTLWETLIRISDFQNRTCSLWETLIRISDPDFNPDHAQLWTRYSVFLWSLPPYSQNFITIRPIVYEKSC